MSVYSVPSKAHELKVKLDFFFDEFEMGICCYDG